jgi:8-oxo-dGTP diphosphatase
MMKLVCGFMFNETHDRVLLLHKTKPISIAGMWTGVGGKVEPGETFEDAMVREFREEVGTVTTRDQWEHCFLLQVNDSSLGPCLISFYRGTGDVWQFRQMEQEKPMVWMASALPNDVVPNVRWMIPLMLDPRVIFPLAIHYS